MAEAIYSLGTLTSIFCAVLLFRRYRTHRTRLLLWSSLCFIVLAINNVELLVDLYLVPNLSLIVLRNVTALIAMLLMLFGLLWDVRG